MTAAAIVVERHRPAESEHPRPAEPGHARQAAGSVSAASSATPAGPAAGRGPNRPAGPMIRAHGIGRQFGATWAVRDLDLELAPGEVVALLGPNGAGKTTTVRLLTALVAPSAGEAWLDGLSVRHDGDAIRRRIGLLTETPSLYERLTARENLAFFGQIHEIPAPELRARIERLLRLFELWDRRDDRAGTFSKGMKQKLAIARALLHEPAVLFLDEPTSGLDPEAAAIVRDAIAGLKAEGRTIVLATHNLAEAERLADRVAFVRGTILRFDSPDRLRRAHGSRLRIELATDPGPAVEPAIAAVPGVTAVELDGRRLGVAVTTVETDAPAVARAVVEAGGALLSLGEATASLEQVYFDVFGLRPPANGGA